MPELKQVLVVEDELTNSILLKRILTKAGYSVVVANNGMEALKHLEKDRFDAVLTDWMMPQIDGIELIRRMRASIKPLPFTIMITALVSEGARAYALESGADDYIAKPIDVEELLSRLKDGLARHQQSVADIKVSPITRDVDVTPPYVAVAIATSTGGPPTLIELFKKMPEKVNAPFFIVQHGPSWMLETFSQRLQRETAFNVVLAYDGLVPEMDTIYVAPGDKHMRIDPNTYKITLDEGPKENFVRPAADPLFRSVAEAFGRYSIAIILTGLGKDGTQGAAHIASVKGTVLVQNPETAVAPSMPNSVLQAGINCKVLPISSIGKEISELVFPLNAALKMVQR